MKRVPSLQDIKNMASQLDSRSLGIIINHPVFADSDNYKSGIVTSTGEVEEFPLNHFTSGSVNDRLSKS